MRIFVFEEIISFIVVEMVVPTIDWVVFIFIRSIVFSISWIFFNIQVMTFFIPLVLLKIFVVFIIFAQVFFIIIIILGFDFIEIFFMVDEKLLKVIFIIDLILISNMSFLCHVMINKVGVYEINSFFIRLFRSENI